MSNLTKEKREIQLEALELPELKKIASELGVVFKSNTIKSTLIHKILDSEFNTVLNVAHELEKANNAMLSKEDKLNKVIKAREGRADIVRKAKELVRVRITPKDPAYKSSSAEFFEVSNRFVSVKHYVPLNDDVAEHGLYLPRIIVEHLKSLNYLESRNKKEGPDKLTTTTVVRRSFVIEELPHLSLEELQELGKDQAHTNRVKDDPQVENAGKFKL